MQGCGGFAEIVFQPRGGGRNDDETMPSIACQTAGVNRFPRRGFQDRCRPRDDTQPDVPAEDHTVAVQVQNQMAHVRVEQRLRAWLAARELWRALELCIEFFRLKK